MNNILGVKYIFTLIGGGLVQYHDLYAIMENNSVMHTKDFNEEHLESATPTFLFKLDEELDFSDFSAHSNNIICDAPTCSLYMMRNGKLKKLYQIAMCADIPAVKKILAKACDIHGSERKRDVSNDYTQGAEDMLRYILSNQNFTACMLDADKQVIIENAGLTSERCYSFEEIVQEFWKM